ncbi:hypothetical protein IE53DRAFT_310906 [Violaceomyces palustris]|uniref:Uncharacterized protein n=1 Tax=Violaceomyces palustris TaxID=1673888 RepID=A0ACD0P4Y4_9BASI|nr:hypothetical protein IE53DRAFT_310906 [Violaceomyces palustris]
MPKIKQSFEPSPPLRAEKRVRREGEDGHGGATTTSQQTLFNFRFGPSRPSKPNGLESSFAQKGSGKNGGDSPAGGERLSPDPPPTFPPCRSTAITFLPVSRQDFVKRYAVQGLPGAEVYYKKDFVRPKQAKLWLKELESLQEWYRPKLKVYGREIQQSRQIAAFSTEDGLQLKYSGHPVIMHHPFPPLLQEISEILSSDDCLGSEVRFNHVMLNRYQDGSIYIGKHSDNLENKVIVTLSLGAPRSWIMERKRPQSSQKSVATNDEAPKVKKRWTLENGSLLVMQGDTQRNYTHEIPKELKVKEPRISITFRQLVFE